MTDQVLDSEQLEQDGEATEAVAEQETQSEEQQTEEQEVADTIEQRLQQAEQQAAENLEGWQRARAELVNARKRFERQRTEAYSNALVDFAGQLLPVLDDLELAMGNVPEEIANSDWFGGVELIPRKLQTILQKLNIERIETVGQPFDPNFHSAIMREESEEYDTDVVVKEFQAGYRVGDRVIRPAVVVVAA